MAGSGAPSAYKCVNTTLILSSDLIPTHQLPAKKRLVVCCCHITGDSGGQCCGGPVPSPATSPLPHTAHTASWDMSLSKCPNSAPCCRYGKLYLCFPYYEGDINSQQPNNNPHCSPVSRQWHCQCCRQADKVETLPYLVTLLTLTWRPTATVNCTYTYLEAASFRQDSSRHI